MKTLALSVLLAGLGLSLTACAGGGARSAPTGTRHSAPIARRRLVVAVGRKAVAGVDLRKGARLLSPTRLAIVTSGSSGCPETPKLLVVQSPHIIRIELFRKIPLNATDCPADYTATPFVVAIDPRQIDVHHRLTIRLLYPRATKPVVRIAPPL